jgi:rubredoxin
MISEEIFTSILQFLGGLCFSCSWVFDRKNGTERTETETNTKFSRFIGAREIHSECNLRHKKYWQRKQRRKLPGSSGCTSRFTLNATQDTKQTSN